MYNNKNKAQGVFIMTKRVGQNNITEFGIKIVMDEEKILREQEYNLEDIYNGIDHLAKFAEMKKIDKYYYVSINDTPSALGCFIFANLEEREWFMNNVKEVTWYDDEGVFDILDYIEKRNIKKANEKVS